MNLFPSLRATLKADSYFATTISGFQDSSGRFKCFREGEAPSLEAPYITIDVRYGGKTQWNWMKPYVMLHFNGKDTDWDTLWTLAQQTEAIFKASTCLNNPAGGKIQYELLGDADYDTGRDPVTEQVLVSLGQRFGIVQ